MIVEKLKDIKHLCFDKDGVIIDVHSYWVHKTKIRASFLKSAFGLNSHQEDILIESMGIEKTMDKIKSKGPIGYLSREKIIETIIDTLSKIPIKASRNTISNILLEVDFYQERKNDFNIILHKGIKKIINYASKNDIYLSIFSSDRQANILTALKIFDIDRFFGVIIGGDSVKNGKPNPEGIHKCCKAINIKEELTAYISDTSNDLKMAKQAGVGFMIGVLTGLDQKEQLQNNSDLICDNLYQLTKFFEQNVIR